MKIVIKETILKEIEIDDLDMIVKDELLGVNPEGHDCEWEREKNSSWEEHISIPRLEKTIEDLKKIGATHLQIDSNGDHHSYIFTGIKLDVLNRKEIEVREMEHLKREIIRQENVVKGKKEVLNVSKIHLEKLKKLRDEK